MLAENGGRAQGYLPPSLRLPAGSVSGFSGATRTFQAGVAKQVCGSERAQLRRGVTIPLDPIESRQVTPRRRRGG